MPELHTAKTQALSTTRHISSPERLSLKVNAPQHFKKKASELNTTLTRK